MTASPQVFAPLSNGVVYSKQHNYRLFSVPPLEKYAHIMGDAKIEKLQRAAEKLKGLRLLELNATAQGGGVAEMLFTKIPLLDLLGVDVEWKIIRGNNEFFECTKKLHNLLQGMEGTFSREMENSYCSTIETCSNDNLIDGSDVITVHDPQPLGLASYIKKPDETWIWRCHIDIEDPTLEANPGLWDFVSGWVEHYDAAIFSAAHYVVSTWPLPNFLIPPSIDPLSEKNRELSQEEMGQVLTKYKIDSSIPIIAQVGRFDPWKGINRTIGTYRLVKKEARCQLILAGGMASDDPEGARILADLYEQTKNDKDIHILNLPLQNRLENWKEVNALQRAATVIMQPSTREGFGLVITEALWKGKPVIAANVGAIPLQIKDEDTGYFHKNLRQTARRILHLLQNPEAARAMGERGRKYVEEHFLLPDRLADYLMTIDITMNGVKARQIPKDCIISFHPWFKLSKRD